MAELVSLGAFLKACRAARHPEDLLVDAGTTRRRTPGLRREEVAQLSGISVDYYTRLEQDRAGRVSDEVLAALARGLGLDHSEEGYLRDLARHPGVRSSSTRPPLRRSVPDGVRAVLAVITAPAVLYGALGDILAWNRLGGRLFVDLDAESTPNFPRLLFLDPRLERAYVRHEDEARATVAHLRAQAGRRPDNRALGELVDQLTAGSALFARLWAEQTVRERDHGSKIIRNPLVGELTLTYQVLRLADPDTTLFIYLPKERGSDTERRLARLGELAGIGEAAAAPITS